MLRIRLQRTGRKNRPFYRIVLAEHTAPVKARFLERLGHFDPLLKPEIFEFDEERFKHWVNQGAKPSSTLARMLKGRGFSDMDRFIEPMPDRKKRKVTEEEAAQAAAPPAPAPAPTVAAAAETPAPAAEAEPASGAAKVKPSEEPPTEAPSAEEPPKAAPEVPKTPSAEANPPTE